MTREHDDPLCTGCTGAVIDAADYACWHPGCLEFMCFEHQHRCIECKTDRCEAHITEWGGEEWCSKCLEIAKREEELAA